MSLKSNEEIAREVVKKISDAAIELAFVRHELTTTDYEETEYPDVEEGVEAFKELVEEVKTDVFAVLTGDEEGCLDPEDVDCDNEAEWLRRQLTSAQSELARAVLKTVHERFGNEARRVDVMLVLGDLFTRLHIETGE